MIYLWKILVVRLLLGSWSIAEISFGSGLFHSFLTISIPFLFAECIVCHGYNLRGDRVIMIECFLVSPLICNPW